MPTKAEVVQKTEELLAPARALSGLALANTERLVDMQVEGLRKYSNVVLNSWKDALDVNDIEGAQKFVSKQGEVAQGVVESMVNDAKAVVEMGRDYANEVQKVVSDSLAKVNKKAA